ncbi:MAG: transcriptional regulator, partial [Paenibacillus sp.]|nr:transcriptional regulator [Paenibacillus sp.]
DRMLALMDHRESVPVEELHRIAGQSRTMREQRNDWQDRWNYDHLASTHDLRVESEAGVYSDYTQALDLVASWTSALPTEEGLDLGTGTGNLAGRLLRQGARMAGVDQSQQMLKLCHAKFPQMETRIGNMLAIPYTEGRFDFIVSSFALHHLSSSQIRLALEEMRRVLKPRGRICIADLLFPDERTKESYAESFPEYNGYALLPELTEWLTVRDYIVKVHPMNELLHIVYAVPIR